MNTFYKIIAIVAVIICLFLWFTRPKEVDLSDYIKIDGKEYRLLKKTRDTVYIDKIVKITEYKPGPPKIVTDTVKIPVDVDTLGILHDYYRIYSYRDTIQIDSFGTAYINDLLSENKIQSRAASFDIKIPKITETTIVQEKPKNKLFLGGGLNMSTSQLDPSVYGSVILKTKKDKLIGINLGVSTDGHSTKPYMGASYYFKLKFGNKK